MSLHAVQSMTHPITRIVRLFGYLFIGYLFHTKQVRERDGRGGSINDLILPPRPSILSLVLHLARITQP